MKIYEAKTTDDARNWEAFAATLTPPTHYHRWGWRQVIQDAFDWPTYYFMAEEEGRIVGILPLVWQKSRLFGSFLTSLPFLSGGGAAVTSQSAEERLVQEAIALARELKASHVEFRYRRKPPLDLPTRTNKVAVVHSVEPDAERMLAGLPHKVRSDVRKTLRSGMTEVFGGEELLADFYRIFAINMRDLGTPVYGRGFFRAMLRVFPADCFVCLVRHQGRPIAGSFLMGYRDTLEAGWSSSLYEYLALKPNMFLYWKIFCFAGERGYRTFDFGRSSVGSGTHRFKMQWGSEEIPLYWAFWTPDNRAIPDLNPQNARYRLAIAVWKHLPVGLATMLGPRVVRCLP
jgi:serine/alanine adding enzyme